MNRRNFIKGGVLSGMFGMLPLRKGAMAKNIQRETVANDRSYWVNVLSKMAEPILSNISRGEFRKNMPIVVSPIFDNRDPSVGYLEAFARLLAGMAPWLGLADDETEEGKLRKKFREQALLGIQHGVEPSSRDYFLWDTKLTNQPLVDAAYLAQAFLRGPKSLWEPLPERTKAQVIEEFTKLRKVKPNESNWLLFAATVETFLYVVGAAYSRERIDYALHKFDNEWYVGDGWYSDGPRFSFDHYNGYVIHCMQVECLQHNITADQKYVDMYDRAYNRMQRYAHHLERMIAPDGSFLVVGRSSTYRTAAFQPLASVVLGNKIPKNLSKGQIRAALTAVMKHIFIESTFDATGWLTMGVIGASQSNLADYYTNVGSMYMTSLSFLPLGLPAQDEFWTVAPEKWTSQKVFNGEKFPRDYYVTY